MSMVTQNKRQETSIFSIKASTVQSGVCLYCGLQNAEGMNFCQRCGNLIEMAGVSKSPSYYSRIHIGNSLGANPLIKGNIRSDSQETSIKSSSNNLGSLADAYEKRHLLAGSRSTVSSRISGICQIDGCKSGLKIQGICSKGVCCRGACGRKFCNDHDGKFDIRDSKFKGHICSQCAPRVNRCKTIMLSTIFCIMSLVILVLIGLIITFDDSHYF